MAENKLTNKLILEMTDALSQGKRVRRKFSKNGVIYIDRTLPFLIVYTRPDDYEDPGTDRLIKGEASYLIAPSGSGKQISKLIAKIGKILAAEFGAFLLIEVWAAQPKETETSDQQEIDTSPFFRISASKKRPPTESVEILQRTLKRIKILKRSARVDIVDYSQIDPGMRLPVISEISARRMNCFILGLEIGPVYRNPSTGEVFPLVLSRLHRSLSVAFKKAAFEFATYHTNRKPASYHALGRRAFVKTVWEVDSKLAEISQSFDFLLQVTPINIEKAWKSFKRSNFQKVPAFYYRPQPIDPSLMKRKLYEIPIERIADATLGYLFRQQRKEIDRKLTLLQDRGMPQFHFGAMQLYGQVTDELVHTAREILEKSANSSGEKSGGKKDLNAEEFAHLARIRIARYRQRFPGFSANVQVRDDVVGLIVSKGELLISSNSSIARNRLEATLSHEVGTHILTYYNGRAQPFKQLYCGFPGYEELQEGLAVLSEFLVGQLRPKRLRTLAGRVVAAYRMQNGASFQEVFYELKNEFGFNQKVAFIMTTRIFRGGGLIKDAIYLRGLVNLLAYLKNGGNITLLFYGKIALDYLPIVEDLRAREILVEPPLVPLFMQAEGINQKLADLNKGLDIFDLL